MTRAGAAAVTRRDALATHVHWRNAMVGSQIKKLSDGVQERFDPFLLSNGRHDNPSVGADDDHLS